MIIKKAESTLKFQSTPSVGRATTKGKRYSYKGYKISIHALRGEGDAPNRCKRETGRHDFNPRPPWGGRPWQIRR